MVAASTAAVARPVKRSIEGGVSRAKRLCAACLVTPRALLISVQECPARRHWSTKWPSRASPASASSAAVAEAVESRARGSGVAASASTTAMRSESEGAGVMGQLVVDDQRIVNHRLTDRLTRH